MTTEKLTPEYIITQICLLTNEEICELIRDYGNEQADESGYWTDKNK
jgi:hypothetical protein